ncbi:hypothetical protein H5410_021017 [Solanum commersonii]|uniref:CCHC-type domain-containing protein n=1 Tax=Solanum commersonii TaxID=4109 RepID=A0A9J5ZD14_SOLCO|nr:hypothetical protein H5410_021017 [Solanum commersonii]
MELLKSDFLILLVLITRACLLESLDKTLLIYLVDYIVQVPSRASTSQIRENYRCDNIKNDRDNIARPITKFVFPPLQSFQINKNDKIVNFNAFSKLFENDTALVTTHHINAIIKQGNYANIYMTILSEHIISLHDKVDKLISMINSNSKGKEKVAHSSIKPPPEIGDFKLKDFSGLENFLEKKFKSGDLKPIKDVLLEEHEHIITNSYNGKEIYEWNIDGYTNRQIYTTVHRMLMYSTICKTNKNSDKTIADMIIAGFTSQLKGRRTDFYPKCCYTLVLNIIEYFSGRWSDNSETIRTLLQNLRCKTLTSFRFYKDVFLSRVMELPECNRTHWKSKFIDVLPTLFAERVRKTLRGENHSINYENYTYGKLISTCIQEGISLFNEIKLNQQIKRHRYSPKKKSSKKDYEKWKRKRIERKERRAARRKKEKRFYKSKRKYDKLDTCHKCGRFGHYATDCKVKEKIKNLDIDDSLKDSLYKIMLNSDSGKSKTEYSSQEDSSTSKDLKALQQEDYMSSEGECLPCQQGMECNKDGEEDDLNKIYSQFKELSINVIDNAKVIELLQRIKDPKIRAQINDKIGGTSTSENHIKEEIPTKEGSYTMAEVKNLLLEKEGS